MCEWGDSVGVSVPIPAHLSHTGKERWDIKDVDRCLADLINALNAAGIYTSGCCCGHGKSNGFISLHDGRELVIVPQARVVTNIEAACQKLINYRDRAGALNFQLEKADTYIDEMRVALDTATGKDN